MSNEAVSDGTLFPISCTTLTRLKSVLKLFFITILVLKQHFKGQQLKLYQCKLCILSLEQQTNSDPSSFGVPVTCHNLKAAQIYKFFGRGSGQVKVSFCYSHPSISYFDYCGYWFGRCFVCEKWKGKTDSHADRQKVHICSAPTDRATQKWASIEWNLLISSPANTGLGSS